MGAAPRQSMVALGSRQVAVLSWGPEQGPMMLLMHGFPDTAWSWRSVAPTLAEHGWRVIAPFSRGYAPTDLAGDTYQLGALVRDLLGLHTVLGGDARAVLVGHDWGAMTAYGVGALDESPFAKVVTMSVPPFATSARAYRTPGAMRRALRQMRLSWYVVFNQIPVIPERVFARLIRRLWADWSPDLDASTDIGHVLAALPDRAHRAAAIGYYRAFGQPWRRSRRYAREQQACTHVPTVPTLYLHGTRDGALLPEVAALAEPDLAPGSRVSMIEDAGHFLQLDRPDVVAAAILDFVGAAETQG